MSFSDENWGKLLLGILLVCFLFPPIFGLVIGIGLVLLLKVVIFNLLKIMFVD
jgi:hypothetical protein